MAAIAETQVFDKVRGFERKGLTPYADRLDQKWTKTEIVETTIFLQNDTHTDFITLDMVRPPRTFGVGPYVWDHLGFLASRLFPRQCPLALATVPPQWTVCPSRTR